MEGKTYKELLDEHRLLNEEWPVLVARSHQVHIEIRELLGKSRGIIITDEEMKQYEALDKEADAILDRQTVLINQLHAIEDELFRRHFRHEGDER